MIDVIIVAAGSGKRMNHDKNKQFIILKNKPLLILTLEKFYKNKLIDNIYLVIKKEEEDYVNNLLDSFEIRNIRLVYGGRERQDSVYNCIEEIKKHLHESYADKSNHEKIQAHSDHFVLVHDGARPFVSNEIIEDTIREVKTYNAVCVGVPSKDTVKIIGADNIILSTPDRKQIWMAQTPQAFRFDILYSAYKNSYDNNFMGTDDSSIVENYGIKVKMIQGSYDNIKITTPEDLRFAESILDR